jgi:hypothetical protein
LALLVQLGKDCNVFYLLAAHPDIVYKAALHDCVNLQEVILEIKYWAVDWWEITGPATCNYIIIISPIDHITTNVWDIANF